MKVFEDIFTNDEVLSDALDIKLDETESIISITSKMVAEDEVNVDIGCGNEFGGDEEGGPAETNVVKVNNIINTFGLEEYFTSKDDFKEYMIDTIAKVKKRLSDNKDRLKNWEKGGSVATFFMNVLKKFDEVELYMGRSYGDSMDPKEGMVIVSYWVNDEDTGPTFFYFKDCLRAVKV